MNTHPEREAIEQLIPKLRPFVMESDARFVQPDGTELYVAGISQANFHGGERMGNVAVLCRSKIDECVERRKSVVCSGAVLLQRETNEERNSRAVPVECSPTFVVQGVVQETVDDEGRQVVYPIQNVRASFPLLVTCR